MHQSKEKNISKMKKNKATGSVTMNSKKPQKYIYSLNILCSGDLLPCEKFAGPYHIMSHHVT